MRQEMHKNNEKQCKHATQSIPRSGKETKDSFTVLTVDRGTKKCKPFQYQLALLKSLTLQGLLGVVAAKSITVFFLNPKHDHK